MCHQALPTRRATSASPDGAHDPRSKQVPPVPSEDQQEAWRPAPPLPPGRAATLAVPNERLRSGLGSRTGGGERGRHERDTDPATFASYLTADFFRGSEDSRRAGAHQGDAGALGTVLGVASGRPDSRRPAGVGKADALAAPNRLCEAGPEERLAGVLWTTALEDKMGLQHRRPPNTF